MAYTDITTIPGIESSIAQQFEKIGVRSIADLKQKDPELLFNNLKKKNKLIKQSTSPILLYVLRMSVYFANGGRDSDKLAWSAWRD